MVFRFCTVLVFALGCVLIPTRALAASGTVVGKWWYYNNLGNFCDVPAGSPGDKNGSGNQVCTSGQLSGQMPTDGAQITVVYHDYRDTLVTDEFKLEVPEAATILGLTVEIRRAGDETVGDDSVRIVKNGVIGAAERARADLWTEELQWVSYGGEDDLWGEDWTPQDLNADDFGVALSVAYTRTVGNTRAYVDQVRVSVHYTLACAP